MTNLMFNLPIVLTREALVIIASLFAIILTSPTLNVPPRFLSMPVVEARDCFIIHRRRGRNDQRTICGSSLETRTHLSYELPRLLHSDSMGTL